MAAMRILLIAAALVMVDASSALAARNVELLHGTVRPAAHSANGRAAVVLTGRKRVLTLRSFRISPGPKVHVYLVPRAVKGDGDVRRDFKDLGALKGSKGNQQYAIPGAVDLRRYTSVIFWCVPFTSILARANLTRS
jgi:hypothetical protein